MPVYMRYLITSKMSLSLKFNSLLGTVVIFVICFGDFLVSAEIYFSKGAPHVKLSEQSLLAGTVQFSRDGRPFSSFIGIPFGQVPGRFEASQPFPPWEGVRDASKPGPVCAQELFGDAEGEYGQEDCLNLNVYIPMKNIGKRFPVMVWIHGGGFQYGDGVQYGPTFFMDEDVILVTINYRLGVLGFLSTGDSVVPGNNGLKDQVLALGWVQKHIKNFGGDPKQVTIFGESAGGASVHFLLLSPTTDGLFQRAISQSNSAASVLSLQHNPRSNAVELATHLNCPTSKENPSQISSEEIVSCLGKLTASELIRAQFSYKKSWPLNYYSFYFIPTAEPEGASKNIAFLTESPLSVLRNTDRPMKKVPWMVGVTEDEGCSMYSGLVLNQKELTEELDSTWDSLACSAFHYDKFMSSTEERQTFADIVRKFYFGDKSISLETRENLTNLYSDSAISYGVYRSALETASREDSRVYLYQYAYPGPLSLFGLFYELTEKEAKQVGHADDLQHQFVLGEMQTERNDEDVIIKPDSADERFSKNFVKLWASFAIHGEPRHTWGNEASSIKWNPISKSEVTGREPMKWYRIESNPTIKEDLYKDRMQFWEEIYEAYIMPHVHVQAGTKKIEL